MKLIIAGKVDPNPLDQAYFANVLNPLIDGKRVQFLGEADARLKRQLYAKARALIMPLLWEEPFGLVMVEAMACGTPVVAFRRGAAPEVIIDGKTGFLVDDVDEMVQATMKIDQIDPKRCRRHVEVNFGPKQMADGYLQAYRRIIDASVRQPALTALTVAPSSVVVDPSRESAVA
jgi:glycosyltransferase involved in cell wall biosynthesis